jgi:hypothetical protein
MGCSRRRLKDRVVAGTREVSDQAELRKHRLNAFTIAADTAVGQSSLQKHGESIANVGE